MILFDVTEPDGTVRTVGDTGGVHAVTGRPLATIRVVCRELRGPDGYDVELCERALRDCEVVVLTASEAQRYLGIPANRIYQWVFRQVLAPVGRDGRRPQYLLSDLQRLNGDHAP